jgi:predicted peptidase
MHRMLLLLALLAPAFARHHDTGFLDRTVHLDGQSFRYQVYVPFEWTKSKRWPVILFLHGSGERGDDGLQETQVGIGRAIRMSAQRFPAIVVMPQCRNDAEWSAESKMGAQALGALRDAMKEFHGDPDRVYLTGLSMGGYGSWQFAQEYPDKWAAAVVICGGIREPPPEGQKWTPEPQGTNSYAAAAKKIGNKLPIWVFHGGSDPVVPVEEARRMVEELKAIGSPVKYTEYPRTGHNSWDKAYAEPELATWLFEQHR